MSDYRIQVYYENSFNLITWYEITNVKNEAEAKRECLKMLSDDGFSFANDDALVMEIERVNAIMYDCISEQLVAA